MEAPLHWLTLFTLVFKQRLAIELSRNHPSTAAAAAAAAGNVSDMSHVSLLEQSLDSMDDDNDHMVTKQQGDSHAVTRQVQSVRPRATVHTALDVETASGTFGFNTYSCSIIGFDFSFPLYYPYLLVSKYSLSSRVLALSIFGASRR